MSSNIKAFVAQIQRAGAATKKPFANVVNKALKNVAFRAMSATPYADPAKIEEDLRKDKILLKIATKMLSGRAGKEQVDRHGNTRLTARGRAKKYGALTRAAISRLATKLLRIRKAGARAARAGWIPAIKATGGSPRGQAKLRGGTSVSAGGAEKATPGKLRGRIWNALVTRSRKTRGKVPVEQIVGAVKALDEAVAFVTADMKGHLDDKEIRAALRKYSDR